MDIIYDPTADAFNIVFKEGKVAHTKEISNGILLDVDKEGTPLYLEVLDASKRFKKSKKTLRHNTTHLSSRIFKISHARRKTATIK